MGNYVQDNWRFVTRIFHDFTCTVEATAKCKGTPLTTLRTLAGTMEDDCLDVKVKDRVVSTLSGVGASQEFCDFFAEALQCEHDMITTVYRLQRSLSYDRKKPFNPTKVLHSIQELNKNFNSWKGTTEDLCNKGKDLPPLRISPEMIKGSRILKALCSFENKDVHLHEGETLTITDTTQPNKLRIRDGHGSEGYVPSLCCILPTPDKSALNAAERLQVQLLASWTECVKKTQSLLLDALNSCIKQLSTEWTEVPTSKSQSSSERVSRRFKRIQDTINRHYPNADLNRLHNTLFSLERELTCLNVNGTDVSKMIESIANLDKSVLCHQMLHKQWLSFRKDLEQGRISIRIMDGLDDLRVARPGKCYKYFEFKMTLENTETVEEILYVNDKKEMSESRGDEWSVEAGARQQSVKTDQVTSTHQEEKRRYIINSVTDPRSKKEISMREAMAEGVINPRMGLYLNPETGHYMPIQEAMNRDFIKVEYVSTRRSEATTTAIGLVTVKTRVDNRPYSISYVLDSFSGEKLSLEEARSRGVIDESQGSYIIGATGEKITLISAIEGGWVIPEYGPDTENEYELKTYAISSVVDQRLRKKVPFQEAVRRRLINPKTGNYVNNMTGAEVYVVDAIAKGFLKAKEIQDASGLDIDATNQVVVERVEMIRKNVLRPIGIIRAMKRDGLKDGEIADLKTNNNVSDVDKTVAQ